MKVRLNVLERLVCASLLPERASYATFKLVQEAREALSFDQEEHERLRIRQEGDAILWDTSAEQDAEIELGGVVVGIIASALKTLDEDESLEAKHISLYEKFVGKEA